MAAIDPKHDRIVPRHVKLPNNTETEGTADFESYELLLNMEREALLEMAEANGVAAKKTAANDKVVAIRSLGWAIQISPSKKKILGVIQKAFETGQEGGLTNGPDEVLMTGRKLVSGIRMCERSIAYLGCFF